MELEKNQCFAKMAQVRVETPLALQRGTINLLAVGHPILVVISHDGDEIETDSSQLVMATANRSLTGTSLPEAVQVSVTESGDHVVTFDPAPTEKEDYTLAVFHKGEQIPGSPFFLRYVDPLALSSVHTERRQAVADAGKLINFIVPLEVSGELGVTVEGPYGMCKVDVNHFSLEKAKESASLHFEPKGLGAYLIHLTVNNEEVSNSPFLILADFCSEEARKCRIYPEDEHLFNKRLRFKGNKEVISFRVYTQAAVEASHGTGELSILCSGSKKADVHLTKAYDGSELEVCEVIPSAPGNYKLSMLWKGEHICDSPRVLQFRRPKNTIVANGLNLHSKVYHLLVPYSFKLNCSNFGGGAPDISCEPGGACDISVVPVEDTESTYKCELIPKLAGVHLLSVKFKGKEIGGSPFRVKFENTCNPAACKIVQGSKTYTAGGILGLKVSTEGAGPGTLEATAEDPDTHITISLTITQVSTNVYQLEFSPGENAKCYLSITYSKRNIPGSPFKLVFSDPKKIVVKGKGVIGGCVGAWNMFTVQLVNPPPGELGVTVKRDDQLSTETSITSVAEHKFEVKYLPTVPGHYTIEAKWGRFPIPGSPFHVDCTSALFQLRGVPKKSKLGSKLSFEAFLMNGGPLEEKCSLEVLAKTVEGGKLRGVAILDDGVYTCSLVPRVEGKHLVSVKWNKLHIEGSPFDVKVVGTPIPEKVRVYGPGVELGEVGGDREFTIETGAAGGGLLAVKIRGPSKELQFETRQDHRNKRALHTKYHPTIPGRYCVEVKWSGKHVPGSPFDVDLSPLSQEGDKLTVVADVHPTFVGAATSAVHPESVDMEGKEAIREVSDSKILESPFADTRGGSTMSLSPFGGGTDTLLSQDSRHLDTPLGEVSLGRKSRSPGEEYQNANHISIYVEERDSVCSDGPRKILSYDAEVQFLHHRPAALTTQDSLESNTSSLYDVIQAGARRLSDDHIDLGSEMSFTS